jgi:multiple antibiotic resistance protein
MSIFSTAVSLFLILNSLGNIPIFVGILGEYPVRRQRRIILRELLIALVLLLAFNFFGDEVLELLGISHAVIGIAGGTLLFLISLTMIFPKVNAQKMPDREPFLFPLAVPVVAGPGAITTVMIYAQQAHNPYMTSLAIVLAWIPSTIILLASSNIKLFLGQRGITACERLGGMLICLVAVQMFTSGIVRLIQDSLASAAR